MSVSHFLACLFCAGLLTFVDGAAAQPAFPFQMEMRVPQAPTAFPSGGKTYLMYELHLTNFRSSPQSVQRIEILDAATRKTVAMVEGEALERALYPIGGGQKPASILGQGRVAVAYLSIVLAKNVPVPAQLTHRVILAGGEAEGAVVGTHAARLLELAPPLEGAGWFASDGPGNGPDNHHRRGLIVIDGTASISRRFATDWKGRENADTVKGGPQDRNSYFAYGKNVLAVADALVTTATEGRPENVPGHKEKFRPAEPMTLATIPGNTITLDLGNGQYAHYMHLQPGSVRVKAGDRVRRGQLLGRVGASGDAREPHLHFEVTTSIDVLKGEGVPFVIDRYKILEGDVAGPQAHSLPLNNEVIDFGAARAN